MKHIVGLLLVLLSGNAYAEKGFFGCNGPTDCSLKKTQVADTSAVFKGEAYHALFTVKYTFACNPGGYDSNIQVTGGHGSDTSTILVYSDAEGTNPEQSVQVRGYGPITLTDTNPSDTASAIFAPGCDLTITASAAPSRQQIDMWNGQVTSIVHDIDLHVPFAALKSDINLWYSAHLAAPGDTAGFLKTQIDALRAPGSSEADHKKAAAYEDIIKGNSLADTLAPIDAYITALKSSHTKAVLLREKLAFAGEAQNKILEDAINRAQAQIN